MKVGILGAGNISDTHARAAAGIPGVEVVAVCGTTTSKAARIAAPFEAAVYTDVQAFLRHASMDIVAVGTPSGMHADHTIAALARGLHVLVEKPIDTSIDRIDRVIEEANRVRRLVGVFFQDRLKPDIVRMKTAVNRGELGRPVLVSGRVKWHRPPEYYEQSRWRGTWALDGGGALMNQGIHTVDLLQWIVGPVTRVSGVTATRVHRIETEDTAAAVLEFASGAIGVFEAATSVYPGYARRIELTGEEGTLILEQDRLSAKDLRSPAAGRQQPASDPAESATTATVSDPTPHRRIFEDFLTAIQTGRRPACDAAEGRKSVAIVQAIYTSAREARAVVPA